MSFNQEYVKQLQADLFNANAELAEMKKRAEAAEARNKASQEQEPIGEIYHDYSGLKGAVRCCITTPKGIFPHGMPVYRIQSITPDVAELQRENAKLRDEVEQCGKANVHKNDVIRELTRNLAAYQALCISANGDHPDRMIAPPEELTKLLAEAESKAMPEGWQLVPKQITDAMRDAGNIYVLNHGTLCRIWDDMLASAPQPETNK